MLHVSMGYTAAVKMRSFRDNRETTDDIRSSNTLRHAAELAHTLATVLSQWLRHVGPTWKQPAICQECTVGDDVPSPAEYCTFSVVV